MSTELEDSYVNLLSLITKPSLYFGECSTPHINVNIIDEKTSLILLNYV